MATKECELLTIKEVAVMLGVSTETIRKMSRDGKIPKAITISARPRFRAAEIQTWLEDGCPEVTPPTEGVA